MNKKNKGIDFLHNLAEKLIDITIAFAVTIFICYKTTEKYFIYFNINTSLVFFETVPSISKFAVTIFLMFFPFILVPFLRHYYKAKIITIEDEEAPKSKLYQILLKKRNFCFFNESWLYIIFKILGPLIIFILILISCIYIEGFSKSIVYYSIFYTFLILIINYLISKREKKKNKEDEFDVAQKYLDLFFLIVSLYLFIETISIYGNIDAKNKTDFLITDNYILVYNTSEYGIACEYEIDNNGEYTIDNTKYIKLELNGLKLENINFKNPPKLKTSTQAEENNNE